MQIPVKVLRVGNSRAVLIPMAIAKALGWEVGSELKMEPTTTGVRLKTALPAFRGTGKDPAFPPSAGQAGGTGEIPRSAGQETR